ncbi:MAG: hypothetical protein AAFQ89_05180 [Cyanobacteria bacterium J06626_18]
MRYRLLIPSSLCLVVSALAWQAPSDAQDVCYFVNSAGQVVNLDHLCQGSSTSEDTATQPEASAVIREDSRSEVTTYQIVGPARGTSSRSPTSSTITTNSSSSSTTTSPAVILTDTGSRTIRIQSLQTEDFTITTINNPDRVVNGVLIEGRDHLIIGPGVPQHPSEGETE